MRTEIYQFEDLNMAIFGILDPEGVNQDITLSCHTIGACQSIVADALEQDHAAWLLQRAAATLKVE